MCSFAHECKNEKRLNSSTSSNLGVLFERMRRNGFEMIVSPPEVVTKKIDGILCEPYEKVSIESSCEVIIYKNINFKVC